MTAENSILQGAYEESLYYLVNEDRLFAITDRIDHLLQGSQIPVTVVEQTKGEEQRITEGVQTPQHVQAHERAWYGYDLSDEYAATLAASENRATSGRGQIAINTAVQMGSLQMHVLGGTYRKEVVAKDLESSYYTKATWREARVRITGGRLAICENVSLNIGCNRYNPWYSSVKIDDGTIQQQLNVATGPTGIFKTVFTVGPSWEDAALRDVAVSVIRDYGRVRELLTIAAGNDDDLYEQVRAYVLERRLAKDDWAQERSDASNMLNFLYIHARDLRRIRMQRTETINDEAIPTSKTLEQIGKWLGARSPES